MNLLQMMTLINLKKNALNLLINVNQGIYTNYKNIIYSKYIIVEKIIKYNMKF